MEPRVLNGIHRSALGELFSNTQMLTDGSGSGNNWANGYVTYGHKHGDEITNMVRMQLEACDCCESFMFLQSLGGGTGSGLGSFILESLADSFPEITRIVTPVFPSKKSENVITAPYNAVLATAQISDFAHVILPVDNDALSLLDSRTYPGILNKSNSFDSVNGVVARLLANLTSSVRLGGDFVMYPSRFRSCLGLDRGLKFLVPSLGGDVISETSKDMRIKQKSLDIAMTECMQSRNQLLSVDLRKTNPYYSGIIVQTSQSVGETFQTMSRTIGGYEHLLLAQSGIIQRGSKHVTRLQNTPMINASFIQILDQFDKLYSRKAHIHHYTDFIEDSIVKEAVERVFGIISHYESFQSSSNQKFI